MIFNEMNRTTDSYEAVQESPYELGIGGALMHVYENECNYNALMKAAALSEMKYYNETGGDLFVQEAGAFAGFIEKAKAFFKKVIEKIKAIAKKFIATINQYRLKDADFVKKYGTQLRRRKEELKGFKFNGYKFPGFDKEGKVIGFNTDTAGATTGLSENGSDDQDKINDIVEENRGKIVGESKLSESDFRAKLKEKLYGDKDEKDVNIDEELNIISATAKLIKSAEDDEKKITDEINGWITKLENDNKVRNKNIDSSLEKGGKITDSDNATLNNNVKYATNKISVYKSLSGDLTAYFGAVTKALADRNRQAKAICVKALTYKAKNESAVAEGYNNIFAGVEII